MAGASYDRYNAYVALPQIEKDVAEVKELVKKGGGDSSCPFPVNSVLMFDDETDPNDIWTGTNWETIGSDCYLIGQSASKTAGTTGGSNTVSLTTDNLPKHSHSTPSHGHGFTQPSVTGGSCDITSSGSHGHQMYYKDSSMGSSSGNVPTTYGNCTGSWAVGGASNPIRTDTGEHTHSVPAHSHTVSGGAVESGGSGTSGETGSSSASITIQPSYYSVAIWKRTE